MLRPQPIFIAASCLWPEQLARAVLFKHNHLLELGTIVPGEFIGEGAFINNRERSTSARAKTDTIVLAITPEALTRLPNVIREKIKDRIIEGMSERIAKLSNYLETSS